MTAEFSWSSLSGPGTAAVTPSVVVAATYCTVCAVRRHIGVVMMYVTGGTVSIQTLQLLY